MASIWVPPVSCSSRTASGCFSHAPTSLDPTCGAVPPASRCRCPARHRPPSPSGRAGGRSLKPPPSCTAAASRPWPRTPAADGCSRTSTRVPPPGTAGVPYRAPEASSLAGGRRPWRRWWRSSRPACRSCRPRRGECRPRSWPACGQAGQRRRQGSTRAARSRRPGPAGRGRPRGGCTWPGPTRRRGPGAAAPGRTPPCPPPPCRPCRRGTARR
mmetsp:Transcript_51876/g.146197  ORF Transcript_51876/g.146197 Transcript_51876/m.146197 type:complete len:214 (-) Transcript_51876:266-907(-)